MGSIWAPFGVHLGSSWVNSGVTSVSGVGANLGSFQGRSARQPSNRSNSGIGALRLLQNLGALRAKFGPIRGRSGSGRSGADLRLIISASLSPPATGTAAPGGRRRQRLREVRQGAGVALDGGRRRRSEARARGRERARRDLRRGLRRVARLHHREAAGGRGPTRAGVLAFLDMGPESMGRHGATSPGAPTPGTRTAISRFARTNPNVCA